MKRVTDEGQYLGNESTQAFNTTIKLVDPKSPWVDSMNDLGQDLSLKQHNIEKEDPFRIRAWSQKKDINDM